MGTATEVKRLDFGPNRQVRIYKLDPSITYYKYDWDTGENIGREIDHVFVSAVSDAFDTHMPETYIFPSTEDGKILSWQELTGSFQGGMDHERAIKGLGYEIAKVTTVTLTRVAKCVILQP